MSERRAERQPSARSRVPRPSHTGRPSSLRGHPWGQVDRRRSGSFRFFCSILQAPTCCRPGHHREGTPPLPGAPDATVLRGLLRRVLPRPAPRARRRPLASAACMCTWRAGQPTHGDEGAPSGHRSLPSGGRDSEGSEWPCQPVLPLRPGGMVRKWTATWTEELLRFPCGENPRWVSFLVLSAKRLWFRHAGPDLAEGVGAVAPPCCEVRCHPELHSPAQGERKILAGW